MKISEFREEYEFLSNFSAHKVTFKGLQYANNETAFHAQKVVEGVTVREMLASMLPSEQNKFLKTIKEVFKLEDILSLEVRKLFVNLNPSYAKKLGRVVKLRRDWELIKDNIMYQLCLAKFEQNAVLIDLLLATGEAELEEGNFWRDTYWGVCNGVGLNKLGLILMQVRKELKERVK